MGGRRTSRDVATSQVGRWGAVTALMRTKRWRVPLLRAVFAFGNRTDVLILRLKRMRVVMYARWTFLPSSRHPRYLLFETNWSGPQASYIPDFGQLMQTQWSSIFDTARGFPGPVPTTQLVEYVDKVDWGSDHYWTDYGQQATTQTIMGALDLSERFERFERRSRGLSPDEFALQWSRFVTESQDVLSG